MVRTFWPLTDPEVIGDLLEKDATLKLGTDFGGVTLAQNVGSKAEVDAALAQTTESCYKESQGGNRDETENALRNVRVHTLDRLWG